MPLGVGAAIFLAELAPDWLSQPLGFLAELLAAVPSVVYGLWGLFAFIPVLVKPTAHGLENSLGFLPLFQGPIFGPSRLAAGLAAGDHGLPDHHGGQPRRAAGHPRTASAKPPWRWVRPAGR